ncbi:hypothetical protein B9T34_16960 [Acinetobacter sp. ANC 3813]|nr:hypothetical protein B9T34_16960 [Acinetobacter sp. ANC 3813]
MECLARRRGKRIENTINNKIIMKREETTAQKKPELARAFFFSGLRQLGGIGIIFHLYRTMHYFHSKS